MTKCGGKRVGGGAEKAVIIKQPGRILYLDMLRIIATMAVVIIHVCAIELYTADVHSMRWLSVTAWDSLVRWAVPVFVMISGYFFLDNSRPLSIKKLLFKNIARLVLVFIAWSFIYAMEEKLIHPGTSWRHLLLLFVQGKYHMWFLWMITGLYLATPILRKITADKEITKYFLILGIITALIIPTLRTILWALMAVHPSGILTGINNVTSFTIDTTKLNIATGYTVYYVLGYATKHSNLTDKQRKVIYGLALLGFILTFMKTAFTSLAAGHVYEAFFDNSNLSVAFEALGVFTYVKYHEPKLGAKKHKEVSLLSANTFGIYLVHVLIIDLLVFMAGPIITSLPPLIYIPIISAAVFVISLLITAGLRRVPHLKRIVS